MRAPPLRVCSGRLSAARPSTLLRFSFHCASPPCAASMSSTASSVNMLAMSWSKSVTISSATSAAGVAPAAAAVGTGGKEVGGAATAGATVALRSGRRGGGRLLRGTRRGDDSFFQVFGGPFDAAKQSTVRLEEPGRLVEMRGHGAHGIHAIGQQHEVRAVEPDAAVESLAYPVLERRSEANAVPGFGHARAARQRMAGAIGLFADHVRRAARMLGLHVTQHCVDVDLRLAAVDLAQLQVGARFFVRRRQHHVLAGLRRQARRAPNRSLGLRGLRSPGAARAGARLQRGYPRRSPPACRPGAYRACARELPSWPSGCWPPPCSRRAHGRDRRCPGRARARPCRPRARSRAHPPSPRNRAPWPGSPASAAACSRSPG